MKARTRCTLLSVATATALLLLAAGVNARPGGGHHFRSPSRSSFRSSSSRSSSHSSGSSSWSSSHRSSSPVVFASTRHTSSDSSSSSPTNWGKVAIVLLCVVGLISLACVLVWLAGKQKPGRATVGIDPEAQSRAITALRSRDSGFSPAEFCERTKTTMAKVNEAWLAGNMTPARRLISDGVFVRFQTLLTLLQSDGVRNVMANWRVVSADILTAECDDLWDAVHVRVIGEARDRDVPVQLSPEEALAKVGHAPLEQYHEVWSFLRRRGKTTHGAPALEGRCPGCGADLPLSEAVRCEFCQALVNSGEHDWVLAEITQPEEWSAWVSEEKLESLEKLRQRDPSISRQELEDRASVIFWKWVEARKLGKTANLNRFCLEKPETLTTRQNLLLDKADLRQVAAGSAEVVNVTPDAGSGRDQVTVKITWSASVDNAEPEGTINLFIMERSSTAVSKRGLSSLDCPVCAGNLPESDAVVCGYCGEALSGGKHEWALAQVLNG